MRVTLKSLAAAVLVSAMGASSLAAAASQPAAGNKRNHHHHRHSVGDIARNHMEQRRLRATVSPAAAPAADPEAAQYGYVNNANCPAHLTNPHQATPDGFWYTPFGKKVNCF